MRYTPHTLKQKGQTMRKLILTAALTGLAWLSAWSLAATLEDAHGLLDKGDARGAESAALGLNTPDSYALAAKAATLGAGQLPDDQQEAALTRAVGYAKKAIELGPNDADAYFELARADGRLAQYKGVLQSLGLAGEVKNALNKAIDLDPKLAPAYVALGLWNAEVPFFAGGNKAQVQPNFEKAIQLEPGVVTHRLEYAGAVMKVNLRNKPVAIRILERAVLLTPHDYWEQQDLSAAKKMLADLKK